MPDLPFTTEEIEKIRELFGDTPGQLTEESFRKALRELRAKYHPDNFEKFGDATVRQLATDRFQMIQRLAEKLESWYAGAATPSAAGKSAAATTAPEPIFDPRARFACQSMKIEIRTSDKDLKYHLFGTFYRWLMQGERFKIPDTGAFLIADEEHLGRSIGFMETIRLYLTFEENDPVESIAGWLFPKIAGRASALLVESEIIPIEYEALLLAIKRRSFRALSPG